MLKNVLILYNTWGYSGQLRFHTQAEFMKHTGNPTSRLFFLAIFVKYFRKHLQIQVCKNILSSKKNGLSILLAYQSSLNAACYAIQLLNACS